MSEYKRIVQKEQNGLNTVKDKISGLVLIGQTYRAINFTLWQFFILGLKN